jgi:hypothetical protein
MISSSRGRGDPLPDRSHDDQNRGRNRCSLKSKGVSLPQRRLKREENNACRIRCYCAPLPCSVANILVLPKNIPCYVG